MHACARRGGTPRGPPTAWRLALCQFGTAQRPAEYRVGRPLFVVRVCSSRDRVAEPIISRPAVDDPFFALPSFTDDDHHR